MHLWLLLIGVLLLQEQVSAALVILEAVRAHYSILLIHLLWLALTLMQIYLGYILGKYIQKRFTASRLETWIQKWTHKATDIIGKNGERVGLIFFTILTAPFFSGLVASWLPISFWNVLLFSTLGSLVWYILVWISVYGANTFASNLQTALISVIIISVLLSIPLSIWRQRKM